MSKCLILFVEGDTEVEFYKRVIANARSKRENKMFDTSIECRNVNGVGGFKNIALRKFVKDIKPKYDANCEFTIVLCSDTDLRLKKCTKVTGSTGYDKLMRLYKQANKVYYKGMKSNGMVAKLDIDKISLAVKDQLAPLYKVLGVTI